MVQGSPQFTPRQLLDAGRRAEAEGKLDHANQLYRHLSRPLSAYTTEAAEARNGLGRIGIGAGTAQQLWAENGARAGVLASGRSSKAGHRAANPAPKPAGAKRAPLSDRARAGHAGELAWAG